MTHDDWKPRWQGIGPERRRRILRAIHRGEAVSDPRDAALAVELIKRRLRQLARFDQARKWLSPQHFLVLAGFGMLLAFVSHDFVTLGVVALVALYLVPLGMFLSRLESRAKLSREENEKLLRLL